MAVRKTGRFVLVDTVDTVDTQHGESLPAGANTPTNQPTETRQQEKSHLPFREVLERGQRNTNDLLRGGRGDLPTSHHGSDRWVDSRGRRGWKGEGRAGGESRRW